MLGITNCEAVGAAKRWMKYIVVLLDGQTDRSIDF
jgi:hypothetical protein